MAAVQALEVNQSVLGRQLEELHTHQWTAIKMLQVQRAPRRRVQLVQAD
jgi:hypothetical protein